MRGTGDPYGVTAVTHERAWPRPEQGAARLASPGLGLGLSGGILRVIDQGRRGRHAINAIRHPHRPVEWLVETKPHGGRKGRWWAKESKGVLRESWSAAAARERGRPRQTRGVRVAVMTVTYG